MLSSITSSVTQKVFLPLWVGLIAFIFFDISTRITAFESDSNSSWKLDENIVSPALRLEQKWANSIIIDLNNYEVTPEPEAESNNTEQMSEAEQMTQKGDLGELFSGNLRYRLVGIFDKGKRFAVIQQHNISINEQKLIKLNVLAFLKNYQITKILANRIILNSTDNRQVSLYLYSQRDKSH